MIHYKTRSTLKILLTCLIGFAGTHVNAQSSMPEVLDTGSIQEQYDYLDGRTRIYNDFRAIREDMFQKIKSNSNDSLSLEKNKVQQLNNQIQDQNVLIESQKKDITSTNTLLDEAIKNRDGLTFLGIPMHKALYNTIMFIVIAVLTFLLVILFLTNKRLLVTSKRNKSDLEETREEFEAYRKQTRIRQEELVVKHHNEIKNLKGT